MWPFGKKTDADKVVGDPNTSANIEMKGDGFYEFEIVGESFYQDNLEDITGGKDWDSADLRVSALLVPENNNPYDANAVAVYIQNLKVGHLGRDDAAAYRDEFGASVGSVKAMIVGGWFRGDDDEGSYGVKLDWDW